MASYNRITLIGNLTKDIEIRHTNGNMVIGNFGMACNRKFKTQSGEQREEVLFVDCTAFGKTAEIMAQYLSRGRAVFIDGRLKLDQWEDKNGGGKRSKHSVVVESFQFLDSKNNDGPGTPNTGGHSPSAKSGGSVGGINPDDLPF